MIVSRDWAESEVLAARAVLIDARPELSYRRSHLPGALPGSSLATTHPPKVEALQAQLGALGISGDEPLVVYGSREEREAVARLVLLLEWAGCPKVRVLNIGFEDWPTPASGLKRRGRHRPPATFRLPPSPRVVVDHEVVRGLLGTRNFQPFDLRGARGWDGNTLPSIFASGHLPGSLPLDLERLLGNSSGWPEPLSLRRRLEKMGPRPSDPVDLGARFLLYSQGDLNDGLALAYLLFRIAGLEVSAYAEGWEGWTEDPTRPVARVVSAPQVELLLSPPEGIVPGEEALLGPRAILDLREERDYRLGHLPGALSLPFYRWDDRLDRVISEILPGGSRSEITLTFYCYGPDCVRSWKAIALAARAGFRNLLWFRGGIAEWEGLGLPLVEEALE